MEEKEKEIKCSRCSSCCQIMTFFWPLTQMGDSEKWLFARGFRKIQQNDDWVEYQVDHICPQLQTDGTCRIHDIKPKNCSGYPENMYERWEQMGLDPARSMAPKCAFREASNG